MLTTLKSYVHVFTVTGLIAGIYGVPSIAISISSTYCNEWHTYKLCKSTTGSKHEDWKSGTRLCKLGSSVPKS